MKVVVSKDFSIGEWRHTVLELYALDGPWPTEGEPADWIGQKAVAYCQGEDRTVIIFTPIWRILWWKMHRWAEWAWSVVANLWYNYTPWGRKEIRRIQEWWDSLERSTE